MATGSTRARRATTLSDTDTATAMATGMGMHTRGGRT